MTELRLQIEDDFLKDLRGKLGSNTKASEIVRDALTVYNWAAEERVAGRLIMSIEPDGTDPARLVLAPLERAAQAQARARASETKSSDSAAAG